jgi:hypothetical protein
LDSSIVGTNFVNINGELKMHSLWFSILSDIELGDNIEDAKLLEKARSYRSWDHKDVLIEEEKFTIVQLQHLQSAFNRLEARSESFQKTVHELIDMSEKGKLAHLSELVRNSHKLVEFRV